MNFMAFASPKNFQWLVVKRQFHQLSLNLFKPSMFNLSYLCFLPHIHLRPMQLKISHCNNLFATTLIVGVVTIDFPTIMAIVAIGILMAIIEATNTTLVSTNLILRAFVLKAHLALELLVKYVALLVMKPLTVMIA
ncbi:hypothetical protein COP1_024678 [Malus domestica]